MHKQEQKKKGVRRTLPTFTRLNVCVCVLLLAELEELLLSLKQVRGCLSDQQSQNDVELVLALLNKVI